MNSFAIVQSKSELGKLTCLSRLSRLTKLPLAVSRVFW